MTLDKLTTPFERRCVIEYGKDGNKVVRHWYEVQRVIGTIYKTRDFPDQYGAPQFKLCVFFDGIRNGLKWQWMSHPEYYTAEMVQNAAKRDGMDSMEAMLSILSARMESEKFIGNAEIEFVRQFDPTAAERFAQYRLGYYARKEEQDRQEHMAQQAKEESENARRQAEAEAVKAKYYGWADTMTPLRFGKVHRQMEGFARSDGKVMHIRDFIVSLVKDGWKPIKQDNIVTWHHGKQSRPRTEHKLYKDGYSYKVSKTEYDFAVYLVEHKEILEQG